MFYLYLIIFSLSEFYLFRSLNHLLFHESLIIGDFIFSLICTGLAFLIVLGTLHIKHLNSDRLKKVGLGIIGISWIIGIFFLFSFNIKSIINGIEIVIVLSIFGYFVYYYQTVPEGEPDSEENNEDLDEPFSLNNYYSPYDLETSEEFYFEPEIDDHIEKPDLERLKTVINSILEIEDLEQKLSVSLNSILNLVNQIDNANSEYKSEIINDIHVIIQNKLDNLISPEIENDIIEQNSQTLDLISKNLENIYYNTRGAQVYRNERDLHEIVENSVNQ